MSEYVFEWDEKKDLTNQEKHNISFKEARRTFEDTKRIIAKDIIHNTQGVRYYCIGTIARGIATVRFTFRNKTIRIIGAGFWRKGRRLYEQKNQAVHRK